VGPLGGGGPFPRCVPGGGGAPAPLSWAALPYMAGDLRLKRAALHRAGATLAVSEAIAAELRAAGLPRVEVLPNMVDAVEARRLAEPPPSFALPERFVLFVGKLEENKGARLLVPALAASGHKLPLVVLGEGSLAHAVRYEAAAAGIPLINRGWAEREDVLRALARAEALVFPAVWPEPLSRVLLEALALGVPAAAIATGGTGEILREGSGLLAADVRELGDALGRLLGDAKLRRDTSERARERARAFAPETLIPRYEDVYRRLSGR
jgi:glycogen synthase